MGKNILFKGFTYCGEGDSTVELEYSSNNSTLTINLKDSNEELISTDSVELPFGTIEQDIENIEQTIGDINTALEGML